ncbi:hypothetical protein KHP09_27115, partial [Pseudomonas sp. VS59]|uniref:hypothetical protein n=1 Tax=Pseudomonas sp. VS59 TaxID=2834068 RepID=UPI001BDF068A
KPAPTFDCIPMLELGQMWEICGEFRAVFAGKPAPTFDCIPMLELGQMWELACLRRGHQQR